MRRDAMVVLGPILTVLVCGALLRWSAGPARAAALVVITVQAGSLVVQRIVGFDQQLPVLLADLALLAGFAVLSHLHRRAWLAVLAMLLIALLIAHAVLADGGRVSPALALAVRVLNLTGLAVLVVGGVLEARRDRAAIDRLQRRELRAAGG